MICNNDNYYFIVMIVSMIELIYIYIHTYAQVYMMISHLCNQDVVNSIINQTELYQLWKKPSKFGVNFSGFLQG